MIGRICTIVLVMFFLNVIQVVAQSTVTTDTTYILDLAWSPDNNLLVVVGTHPGFVPQHGQPTQTTALNTHGYISIINMNTGNVTFTIEPTSTFTSVAWSPDGRRVALGSYDGTVWVMNAQTGEIITHLYGHHATITDVDWNSTGTQIVSGGNWDELVILWDAVNYTILSQFEVAGFPQSVQFSPDDQTIALGTDSGFFLFPTNTPANTRIRGDYLIIEAWITELTYNNEGSNIAVGTIAIRSQITGNRPDSLIYIFDVSTWSISRQFQSSLGSVTGLAWDPSNRHLAVANDDNVLTLWDVELGISVATYPTGGVEQFRDGIAYSGYGGRLVLGNWLDPNMSPRQINSSTGYDRTFIGDGIVQIVVPVPSIERLNTIAQFCGAIPADAPPVTVETLDIWLAELDSPTRDTPVPPACIADLEAIADALPS